MTNNFHIFITWVFGLFWNIFIPLFPHLLVILWCAGNIFDNPNKVEVNFIFFVFSLWFSLSNKLTPKPRVLKLFSGFVQISIILSCNNFAYRVNFSISPSVVICISAGAELFICWVAFHVYVAFGRFCRQLLLGCMNQGHYKVISWTVFFSLDKGTWRILITEIPYPNFNSSEGYWLSWVVINDCSFPPHKRQQSKYYSGKSMFYDTWLFKAYFI